MTKRKNKTESTWSSNIEAIPVKYCLTWYTLHYGIFLIWLHTEHLKITDITEVFVGMTATLQKVYTALLNPQGFLPQLSWDWFKWKIISMLQDRCSLWDEDLESLYSAWEMFFFLSILKTSLTARDFVVTVLFGLTELTALGMSAEHEYHTMYWGGFCFKSPLG